MNTSLNLSNMKPSEIRTYRFTLQNTSASEKHGLLTFSNIEDTQQVSAYFYLSLLKEHDSSYILEKQELSSVLEKDQVPLGVLTSKTTQAYVLTIEAHDTIPVQMEKQSLSFDYSLGFEEVDVTPLPTTIVKQSVQEAEINMPIPTPLPTISASVLGIVDTPQPQHHEKTVISPAPSPHITNTHILTSWWVCAGIGMALLVGIWLLSMGMLFWMKQKGPTDL